MPRPSGSLPVPDVAGPEAPPDDFVYTSTPFPVISRPRRPASPGRASSLRVGRTPTQPVQTAPRRRQTPSSQVPNAHLPPGALEASLEPRLADCPTPTLPRASRRRSCPRQAGLPGPLAVNPGPWEGVLSRVGWSGRPRTLLTALAQVGWPRNGLPLWFRCDRPS
jgi:hypothetical protein